MENVLLLVALPRVEEKIIEFIKNIVNKSMLVFCVLKTN